MVVTLTVVLHILFEYVWVWVASCSACENATSTQSEMPNHEQIIHVNHVPEKTMQSGYPSVVG